VVDAPVGGLATFGVLAFGLGLLLGRAALLVGKRSVESE